MEKVYEIWVDGCDDSTYITFELTDKEYELVKRIAEEITETSEYKCQPIMSINEVME